MSSAILYVAIVAIWACVLVPGWLRRDAEQDGQAALGSSPRVPDSASAWDASAARADAGAWHETSGRQGPGAWQETGAWPETGGWEEAGEPREPVVWEEPAPWGQTASWDDPPPRDEAASWQDPVSWQEPAQVKDPTGPESGGRWQAGDVWQAADAWDALDSAPGPEPDRGPGVPDAGIPGRVAPPAENAREDVALPADRAGQRARIMKARRRMLGLLVALTAVAAAFVALGLAAWWVLTAPVVMLFGYLMLLREASRMDAELRRRRVTGPMPSSVPRPPDRARSVPARPAAPAGPVPSEAPAFARPVAVGARPLPAGSEPEPAAEVIDISARADDHVSASDDDEIYDQYTDAELRAVGD